MNVIRVGVKRVGVRQVDARRVGVGRLEVKLRRASWVGRDGKKSRRSNWWKADWCRTSWYFVHITTPLLHWFPADVFQSNGSAYVCVPAIVLLVSAVMQSLELNPGCAILGDYDLHVGRMIFVLWSLPSFDFNAHLSKILQTWMQPVSIQIQATSNLVHFCHSPRKATCKHCVLRKLATFISHTSHIFSAIPGNDYINGGVKAGDGELSSQMLVICIL